MRPNKKGGWGIEGWKELGTALGAVYLIFVLVQQVGVFNGGRSTNSAQNPEIASATTPIIAPQPPFDSSNISVQFLPQTIENKYSNSNNVLCYHFDNPSGRTNSNFTLIYEWFVDDAKSPNYTYSQNLSYEDVFERTRLNWYSVENYSKVRFRVGLSLDKKILAEADINYGLTKDASLDKYLGKEENITWNDSTIKELINGTNLCGKNDEEQIKGILSFVRNNMNPPLETDKKIYYDQNQVSSEKSWNEKIGTSSEYSYVFAAFLRAMGIPAKIETTKLEDYAYYYVNAYIQGKGRWRIDVFQENKEIKDCSILEKIDKEVEYKDVCISNLSDYIIFDRLVAHKLVGGSRIEYTARNVYAKPLTTSCIKVNITYFDKNGSVVFSETDLLLNNRIDTTPISSHLTYAKDLNFDFESVKIELDEFRKFCA